MIGELSKDACIYVAGHTGLVGSAIVRRLYEGGFTNIILANHKELDLCNQLATRRFFEAQKPDYVFMAAGKVGGIHANSTYPAQFLYDNVVMAANIIDAAYRNGVKKLLYLGSSCIYPKMAPQPIPENALLSGSLEPTNQGYALAKITGINLGQSYRRQYGFDAISAMPCNLYGPGDNYHPENSHVLPALIRRFHEAKIKKQNNVVIWGTGTPLREFMHSYDLADACVFLMQEYSGDSHINIGSGEEISILDLAKLIAEIVGYQGKITTDPSKPDGTPRKIMDINLINGMGWEPKISLTDGIKHVYGDFCRHIKHDFAIQDLA